MTLIGDASPSAAEALARLRAYIGSLNLTLNDRLPPERTLCAELGLSRAALRRAMEVLAREGQIWRHVGRGTFIGARPVLNLSEVKYISSISSPAQIIEARLIMEPELARLAATNGVRSDFTELRLCHRRCCEATSWQVFESWDNRLHYAVAATTRNKLLQTLFETLNAVRRSFTWQTVRRGKTPQENQTTFDEHQTLVDAITHHQPQAAAEAMRRHLESVRTRMIFHAGSHGDHAP